MSTATAAKELGIPFKGPMIQAIRTGRKNQTRRLLKHQPARHGDRMRWCPPGAKYDAALDLWVPSCEWDASVPVMETGAAGIVRYCPYGVPGDRLWCRETLRENLGVACYAADMTPVFVDGDVMPWRWRRSVLPSIHMPRRACRILLEVAEVRVERLEDISEADATAEGFRSGPLGGPMGPVDIGDGWTIESPGCHASAAGHFLVAFEEMYGEETCMSNPWLWVVGFRVLEGLAR